MNPGLEFVVEENRGYMIRQNNWLVNAIKNLFGQLKRLTAISTIICTIIALVLEDLTSQFNCRRINRPKKRLKSERIALPSLYPAIPGGVQ